MGDRSGYARDGSSVESLMLGVVGETAVASVGAAVPISGEGVLGVLVTLTPLRLYAPVLFTLQLVMTVTAGA